MTGNKYENIDIQAKNVQLGDTYITNKSTTEDDFEDFHAQLFLIDASADLAKTIRLNGRRVAGTCKWLLARREYRNWHAGDGLQILWLIGVPGIGKTVLSCFLVEHLQKQANSLRSLLLIHHFCDYKDDETRRNSALGIVRCIMDQLLKKQPKLFRWIKKEYPSRRQRMSLVGSLDGLWAMLVQILQKCEDNDVYIIVDGLDECDKQSRKDLLDLLANLAASMKIKFLITARPDVDIEETAETVGRSLRIDSVKINVDLAAFIDSKLAELKSKKRTFPESLMNDIELKVKGYAGGTFLWASLVLQDISAAPTTKAASKKLERLPSDLPGVYKRILDAIDDDTAEDAAFILRWMVISRRPMNVTELATAQVLGNEGWDKNTVPPMEYVERFMDGFKTCGHLLYHDPVNDTLNLIHRSAKDYLVQEECPPKYRVNLDDAGMHVAGSCWRYLSMQEFERGTAFFSRGERNMLIPHRVYSIHLKYHLKHYGFLNFATEEVQDLESWDRLKLYSAFVRSCPTLDSLPLLRDFWLILFARAGHIEGVQALIDKHADTNVRFLVSDIEGVQTLIDNRADPNVRSSISDDVGHDQSLLSSHTLKYLRGIVSDPTSIFTERTVLQWAAMLGHAEVCKALIVNQAEVDAENEPDRETALHLAAKFGHKDVVSLLLDSGAAVDKLDVKGMTPLCLALIKRRDEIGVLLLDRGANALLKVPTRKGDRDFSIVPTGQAAEVCETILFLAAEGGCNESACRLLKRGVDVAARGFNGRTALSVAVAFGHTLLAKLLAKNGGDLGSTLDDTNETLLHLATARGHLDMVTWLAQELPDVDARANCRRHRLPPRENTLDLSTTLLMDYYRTEDENMSEEISPLQLAAILGNSDVYEVLAQAAANQNMSGNKGIHSAARYGHRGMIERIIRISDPGIDDRDQRGWTALHYAATGGHQLTVLELVRNGRANVNAPTYRGETALHLVAELSSPNDGSDRDSWLTVCFHLSSIANATSMVGLLLGEGADIRATTTSSGHTALHLAAIQGSWPVAKALIEHGADVNTVDHEGRTPLDMTVAGRVEEYHLGWWNRKAYERIAQLLLGASKDERNTPINWGIKTTESVEPEVGSSVTTQ